MAVFTTNIRKWLSSDNYQIALFLAGAICGASIEILLEAFLSENINHGTNLAFLIFGIGFLLMFTVRTVNLLKKQVVERIGTVTDEIHEAVNETNEHTQSSINTMHQEISRTADYIQHVADNFSSQKMSVTYIRNGNNLQDDPGYQLCLRQIQAASSSILIIGDFSPSWMPLVTPGNRNEYLEAIEERIKEAIEDPSISFEYTRIIQRDSDIVHNARNASNILREIDMVSDEQAYVHSYKVQQIKQKHGGLNDNVKVSVWLTEPIPNCPSILLIDHKYMLFTLPTKMQQAGEPNFIRTHNVLLFQDLDDGKAFAHDFRSIFQSIRDDSFRVSIDCPSDELLEKFNRPV